MSARRAALATALVLTAGLAVVIAVRTPWSLLPEPPGGRVPLDPTGGLSPHRLEQARSFAAAIRPASLTVLLLGVLVSALLGLTPLGSRLIAAVGRPVRRGEPGGRRRRWLWVWQVVAGAIVLAAIGQLVVAPLEAYEEGVERRYGLSTSSWGLWLRDLGVSFAIDAGLSALALVLVFWLIRRAPRSWWAWAAGAAAVLVLAGSFLWPVVFEPAFNSFHPLPPGPLRTDLIQMADRNGTPVSDVLVSDASRRTTSLNAYVSGFGSTRRIVLYDTVLKQLPRDQIESIVAHELGHVSADDVLTGTLIGALGAAAGVAALGWLVSWPWLLRRARADGPGDPRAVPLLLFLVAIGMLVATPVQNLVSRHIEARADLHALNLTHDPGTFITMQRRLAAAALQEPEPPTAWHVFFGDHPTEAERVAMAENWARLQQE